MGRFFHRTRCLCLFVLLISIFSLTALAEENSAVLDSLHFEIVLQEDGSALFTETREIAFSGDREFSRYRVNNQFVGPRTFSDWQVLVDGTLLSQLDEPDNENRPENTFAVENSDEENTISIYFRQQGSGTRIFKISYRVENAVKLYSDVGEFSWNLTGETGISDIGMLTATLTVPADIPAEELRIWAHGPLNGTFEKQPDGSAALQLDNVPMGTIVDIRTIFPENYFTGGWKQDGEALDRILAEEKAVTDSANAKREEEERAKAERDAYWENYLAERNAWAAEHPILAPVQDFCESTLDFFYYDVIEQLSDAVAVLVVCVFGLGAIFGRLRRNPDKFRHTPTQSPRYCRELPDDLPAPAVDLLLHFYNGKPDVSRQISAAILELAQKELVHFRMADGDVVLLLNVQLGEKLFPSPTPQEPRVPGYQETLWRFLVSAADESGRVAMNDLKQYVQGNQETAWHFRSGFESAVSREYKERVKTQVVRRPFFGESKLPLLLPVVAGILAMLLCLFSMLYDGIVFSASLMIGVITFAVAAVAIILFCLGRRLAQGRCVILDQQAEDELALWQAFGRFLEDFTTLENKELPDFSAWREYMVYAVAMGHGQKVAKVLNIRYPEAVCTETSVFDDEIYRLMQERELYNAMDSIGREVAEARLPSASSSDSDSSWSDSSGDGGGFSDSSGGSDSGSGGDFID